MLRSHDFSQADLQRVAAALQRSLDEAEEQNLEAAKISQALDMQVGQYEQMSALWKRQEESQSQSQREQPDTETRLSAASSPRTVRTAGRFSMMELPTELRLKICEYLVVSPAEKITIPSKTADDTATLPHAAILRTCHQLNREATPLLYGRNNFAITLGASSTTSNALPLLSRLRWTNMALVREMTFVSAPPEGEKLDPAPFCCTGARILAQFSYTDFRLSPVCMDSYQIRHASNWISCQVMKAELAAFQQQWKELMEPTEILLQSAPIELPSLDWDLATLQPGASDP
ncbi:hypothetical protein PVAG01_01620 [Phlyctema vagabunda]|uniref:F-box domain-containing protein n=1 Tax=Phlyctema vagabunda TaxID=108571 RepID=A0ABR4PXX7_9HELO